MKPLRSMLSTMALVSAFGLPVAVAAEGELRFDGDVYTVAWKLANSLEIKNEYVRSGETVERWQRLITVEQFPKNDDPTGFAKTLFNLAKKQMPGEAPEAYDNHQGQYLLCYFLENSALGKTEFIFQRICKEPEAAGLRVYTFSIHADAHLTDERIREIKSQQRKWLTELSQLHTGLVK